MAAEGGLDLQRGPVLLDATAAYWMEGRPNDGGRPTIVRCDLRSRRTEDITGAPFHPRSRVHEYGGGDFVVGDGCVYFANDDDQRLYRQQPQRAPTAITPAGKQRYADATFDRQRRRLVCVCEDHDETLAEPRNALVCIDAENGGNPRVLVSGADFYASPRISPDGSRLAWLAWNHPNMPWDGSEVWLADVDTEGRVHRPRHVAGGPCESIVQPEWSPDGTLYFLSDRSGWWNLYRERDGRLQSVHELDAEFAEPQWALGPSSYAFASPRQIVCSYFRAGLWHLESIDAATLRAEPIETPYTSISQVRAGHGQAVFRGGSPTESTSIVHLDLRSAGTSVLRRAHRRKIDTRYVSVPRALQFRTAHGETARALFYSPVNPECTAPASERPPLLVTSHGGPTAAASRALDVKLQFWTTRGFAVVDVDYRGSSGYGRLYREALKGQWGVADVDDCVHAARHFAHEGSADPHRLAVRGRSAGGFTALCALTFHDVFSAGASYYGISDLEALATGTHKFESRYTDRLVGPYPACRDVYRARSPIHFVDRLSCPVILLQGLDDKVVPPTQSQAMAAALRRKGLPVAYLPFPGEAHGFRRPETVKASLLAELFFYSRVFRFDLAEPVTPIHIENL
jgi:dipeptidyl aminopeptidase/acylaminoacyl peptidase